MASQFKTGGSRVIELNQLNAEDQFPSYVAIYASATRFQTFSLSPFVMQWSENIQLCQVSACESFWRALQARQLCNLQQLFEPVLGYAYGDDYVAVFANHPWQCLIYLEYQIQQQGAGVYFLNSRLNQNIYKTLGWKYWFDVQEDLILQLEAIGAKRFNRDSFCSRQSQLKRFINRVGVAGPFDLKQVDANAMARRFDYWLGHVWKWTFTSESELLEFPWQAHTEAEIPRVTRDLEYPVNQWVYIEQLLREDFCSLCEQFSAHNNDHINRMMWNIKLFNEQVVAVELSFRHPYSLHRELPVFNTALYQARYVYESLAQQLKKRDKDLDLPENMPFLGWEVVITERLQLPALIWDLFADEFTGINFENLYELQNKLPVPIECYRAETNFFPEYSFSRQAIGARLNPQIDDYQWKVSSTYRPLFYYATCSEIDTPKSLPQQFLERCSNQWWLNENIHAQNRDYYVLRNSQGRASWVYRDFDGKWFKQGEYC